MGYLLLHCLIAKERVLGGQFCSLLGIQWVMLQTVSELLFSWRRLEVCYVEDGFVVSAMEFVIEDIVELLKSGLTNQSGRSKMVLFFQ